MKTNRFKGFGNRCRLRDSVRTAVLAAWLVLWTVPMAQSDDSILEGTPTPTGGGGTIVYKAIVEPGQTYSSVYGVRSDSTDAEHYSEVTINGGTVTGTVYGCRAISGDDLSKSSCNKVDIVDSTVGTVYGGYAYGGSKNASVHQNRVTITGGTVTMYIYGGNADGSTISVTGNDVILNHVAVGKTVYGGCAFNTSSWLSMLRNNVTVNGGTVNGAVYGGYASGSATASNNNTVTIDGGAIIKGSVYGGYALSSNSDAKNNIVYIKDGTLSNHIYGGVGRNANGNTVVLYGGDLSQADLYGYSDGRKYHSDNTLEVWGSNISVRSAQNFENYYFVVPQGMVNQPDRYMLKAGTPVNLSSSKVGVAMQNGTTLNIGDRINLIDKTEGTPAWVSLVGKELKGGTLFTNYDFNLSTTGDTHTLVATAATEASSGDELPKLFFGPEGAPAGSAAPNAKSVVEAQLASVAMIAEGGDHLFGQAMANAKNAAAEAEEAGRDVASFLAVSGGWNRYRTGSHVDVTSSSLAAGLAKQFSDDGVDMMVGVFFEAGYGDYSTHNSFTAGHVRGDGNAHYEGGGLMLQLEQSPDMGLYFQAVGRMGDMHNSWKTNDLSERISYDTDHFYYGVCMGLGFKGQFRDDFGFDVYGKVFWTHQEGDKANLNGEHFKFQDVDSLKTRLGARVNYDGFQSVKPFVGLAWEKEYDGEAAATVNGYRINEPELKGDSCLLECGFRYSPAAEACWHLEFTVAGYVGDRSGVNGQARIVWNF